jgi:hypothetical protein
MAGPVSRCLPCEANLSRLTRGVPSGTDYVARRAQNPAEGDTMLNPDVRRVLDGASIAHLATVLPDGSPHTTPVYVGAHGDRIAFTGPGMRNP